jgi:hypothetical protein
VVVRIDLGELAFGQQCLVAQALDLLGLGVVKGLVRLAPSIVGVPPSLELGRRHRGEERGYHSGIDGIDRKLLADRGSMLVMQRSIVVAAPAPVLHRHLAAALPAPDDALEQGRALTGRTQAIVRHIVSQQEHSKRYTTSRTRPKQISWTNVSAHHFTVLMTGMSHYIILRSTGKCSGGYKAGTQ